MTHDDILRMAREAGIPDENIAFLAIGRCEKGKELLKRFVALVAAAEREACAQIVDKNAALCVTNREIHDVLHANAVAIRARGGAV